MEDNQQTVIRKNLQQVNARIEKAAREVNRSKDTIRLVVVTKKQPVAVIRNVINAGARCLGENYAEEGIAKIKALADIPDLEWQMIGHIQSRKAKIVCENFSLVHSLDSVKLAERMNLSAGETGKLIPVLLEFNLAGEVSKSGWLASNKDHWVELIPEIALIVSLPHLKVKGLMTMPPFLPDPELTRPYFRQLRELKDFLKAKFPEQDWNELSMGTSADFEVAIQEGATMVRIGQAILGPRN